MWRRKKRKMKKAIRRLSLIFLLYIILGATLPFANMSPVSQEFIDDFSYDSYFGESEGVDRARLIETNKDALDIRLRMIREAKERIIISTFDIKTGESTTDIFAALYDAAERGVKIQILVDGFSGLANMTGRNIFYGLGSHKNAEIRFYNVPNLLLPWTFNGRMHDKYILVDDKFLVVGGRNYFDYFVGEYPDKNMGYDREVFIYNQGFGQDNRSSVLFAVEDYFDEVWNLDCNKTVFGHKSENRKSVKKARAVLTQHYATLSDEITWFEDAYSWEELTVPVLKASIAVNPTHIWSKEPELFYIMEQLMLGADERVVIHTPYAVFSKDMYAGIARVAEQIEDSKMLINSRAVGDNLMASADYTLNRDKVLGTGMKTYEFFGDYSSHGKSVLIDNDLSIIGSYNFDMRSAYLDTELMLVIHSPELGKDLEEALLVIENQSLEVLEGGEYIPNGVVEAREPSGFKKPLFWVLSRVIQLVRFLV